MPYTIDAPPEAVKGLPKHAIEIFVSAFNSALGQYKDEGKAMATAWAAVKTKYEKRGDKWVAKEAAMPNLRDTYAELLQENGRRNASADAGRIKKIVALCQELLSSEGDAEGKKVEEALKEATAALAWLKEQAAMKTEDGVQFPAAAFAYVPDPEKPSEWKLRIWEDPEKKATRAQLGRAAAALSPGGFRGQKVEIPAADMGAVKRKIRAEYRKLDVADEDIPKWVKETESRLVMADYVPLAEAEVSGKGIATIVVIKPGFNASKDRYYPPEVLARDLSVFEGVKMFADHPTSAEDKARPERSIKDWVATLKNVHLDDKGQIVGEAIVVEPWMQAKLAALRDKQMLGEMGISINAVGTVTKGEIQGTKTNVIERLVRARSVDFVTEPGAGGMVAMYESDPSLDVDIIGLDTLKERRPDLVKAIAEQVKAETMQEAKHTMEVAQELKEKTEELAIITTERDTLKTQLAEATKQKAIAEAKSVLDKAIGEAQLPEPSKARLRERFAKAETADGVAEAIKAEVGYVAALTEAGKVKGMGQTAPDTETGKKALRESFKRANPTWTDRQLDAAIDGR